MTLSAPNVDIARPQSRHVVPSTERVGGDVRAQRIESKRKRRKESGCAAVVPVPGWSMSLSGSQITGP